MLFVVGEPVAWINNSLTARLNGLSGSNALLLGAILGFSGLLTLRPVNKAAMHSASARNGERRLRPVCHFRLRQNGFGIIITASTMLAPRLFKEFEIETGNPPLLGLAGITEGAIPDGD